MREKNKYSTGIRLTGNFDFNRTAKCLYIIIICICSLMMRMMLMPFISKDMSNFLQPWYEYLSENGGFRAVGDDIGDYAPIYYYYLALLTYIKGIPVEFGIKMFSVVFDFIMAVYVMRIVKLREKNNNMPLIAFAVALCLPTVVLNSAAWGQCDAIYSCFLIMCLYYLMTGNDRKAMIMFGLSFAFKLQAIFFAPMIGILLFRKKIKPLNLLWIPVIYLISIIPAVIAGGDFITLLTVYFFQAGEYENLCLSIPNFWALFDLVLLEQKILGGSGIFFAGVLVVTFVYHYTTYKELKITRSTIVALTMISSFIVPFVLPHMHERYYYPAEIMFVIFAFYYRKKFWLILTSQFCTLQTVIYVLFDKYYMDLRILTLIEIVNIIALFFCFQNEIENPRDEEILMAFEEPVKNAAEGSQ